MSTDDATPTGTEPARHDTIDADHPRPDRAGPDRPGGGHGANPDREPRGLTGDDVAQPDATAAGDAASAGDGVSAGDGATEDDGATRDDDPQAPVERYRNSPGAGLVRDEDPLPEPNEPG